MRESYRFKLSQTPFRRPQILGCKYKLNWILNVNIIECFWIKLVTDYGIKHYSTEVNLLLLNFL